MKRVVSLYLPSWPTDHWRKAQGDAAFSAGTPAAVTGCVVRNYFAVEDEAGEHFWLFRRGDDEIAAAGDLYRLLHGLFA